MIEQQLYQDCIGIQLFNKNLFFQENTLIIVSKDKCNECQLDNLTLPLNNLLFKNSLGRIIMFEQWLKDNVVAYTIADLHYFNIKDIDINNRIPYSVNIYTFDKIYTICISNLCFWKDYNEILLTDAIAFALSSNRKYSVSIHKIPNLKHYPYVYVDTSHGIYKIHFTQLLNSNQICDKIYKNGITSDQSMLLLDTVISQLIDSRGAIQVTFQMSLTEPNICNIYYVFENNVINRFKKHANKITLFDGNNIHLFINQSCYIFWESQYYRVHFIGFDNIRPNSCIICINNHLTWINMGNVYLKLTEGMRIEDMINEYKSMYN